MKCLIFYHICRRQVVCNMYVNLLQCIPTKFVAKYEQVKEQEKMMLKTDDGKSWEMKMEKDRHGNCYMKDGWPEFMSENKIDDMDFLIFRLVGKNTFRVVIYKGDCCLKEPTSPKNSGNLINLNKFFFVEQGF